MGNPATEQDTAPPRNTFRRFVWQTVAGIKIARAFFGRRLFGGAIGLMSDAIGEGVSQAIYARFPGHPHQAPDALAQVGKDTDLYRFRGESDANWIARIQSRWSDYAQGGTDIQIKRVINQWGNAGWPVTWPSGTLTLVESGIATDFSFTITIPYGMILPPWSLNTYGDGHHYGDIGFFYGVGQNTDLPMLLYLVRKWKRSTSKAFIKVYTSASLFTVFAV